MMYDIYFSASKLFTVQFRFCWLAPPLEIRKKKNESKIKTTDGTWRCVVLSFPRVVDV